MTRVPWSRHQPPVFSPIPLSALPAATTAAMRLAGDPRPSLEGKLRRDFAADRAILCGSGTQALQLALLLARQRVASDLVALPAFTCYDVATAAVGADARVLVYDIDPDTLGPDLESLERALGAGARTVVVAPLYGVPIDWRALEALSAQHGAVLVEDAAQGHGATWEGRPLGALGSLSVLSFGRGKGWTGGAGGALLLRGRDRDPGGEAVDPELAAVPGHGGPRLARELRTLAGALGQAAVGRPAMYALPSSIPWIGLGRTRYRSPGPVTAITRAAAALLLRSDEHAVREVDIRRAHGAWYSEWLQARAGMDPVPLVPGAVAGYLRFPVRLPAGGRTVADGRRARRLGIAASYPTALLALDAVRNRLPAGIAPCPGADLLARTLFTLPTHSALTPGERDSVVAILDAITQESPVRARAG
jgi:perosamine synthetase